MVVWKISAMNKKSYFPSIIAYSDSLFLKIVCI